MALVEGQKAPDFTLLDDQGRPVRLSGFMGKKIVLYFYPKDDTPGCTSEACAFRDDFSAFIKSEAVILGISPDTVASHQKFKAKYKLPFSLLADPEKKVALAYGVWKEKSMYGRRYMGVERTTVLIGPDGRVAKVFPHVKVTGHAQNVLDALGPPPSKKSGRE